MTPRQLQTLAFIRAYRAERGFAPTYDTIGAAMGITSRSGVYEHVEALRRAGLLTGKGSRLAPVEGGVGAALVRVRDVMRRYPSVATELRQVEGLLAAAM